MELSMTFERPPPPPSEVKERVTDLKCDEDMGRKTNN